MMRGPTEVVVICPKVLGESTPEKDSRTERD